MPSGLDSAGHPARNSCRSGTVIVALELGVHSRPRRCRGGGLLGVSHRLPVLGHLTDDRCDPHLGRTRMVVDSTEARQSLYPLRAVDRVCDIIDFLADNPAGVTLSFLAATLALPKSSAFRYLAALEVRGYVLRAPDSVGYVLGSPLAGHALPSGSLTERLVGVARPLMARLITPEAPICVLFTLDGASVRCLWVSSSVNDDRVTRVGEHEMLAQHRCREGHRRPVVRRDRAVAARCRRDGSADDVNHRFTDSAAPRTAPDPRGGLCRERLGAPPRRQGCGGADRRSHGVHRPRRRW